MIYYQDPPTDARIFPKPHASYREMCEYAAHWLNAKNNTAITWEDVWNISPTGELAPVFDLYLSALMDSESLDAYIQTTGPNFGNITLTHR